VRPKPTGDELTVLVDGQNHRTGQDSDTARHYRRLEGQARNHFDVASVIHRWSTQDYVSVDRVPFVGCHSPMTDRAYVATGFGGWGLTNGTAAAGILRDLVCVQSCASDDDTGPTAPDGTERTGRRTENDPTQGGTWVSAVVGLVGLWLLLESVLFEVVAAQLWNDLVVEALLVAVGAYNYYQQTSGAGRSVGVAAVAALLGLWLVATPFVYGVAAGQIPGTATAGFWNDVVVGPLTLGLGAYSAYRIHDTRGTVTKPTA